MRIAANANAPVDRTASPRHDGRPQLARAVVVDPEHVEIIKKGVAEWNEWRRDNPRIRPDPLGEGCAALRRGSSGGAI
jgi:hypothetical protein